MAAGLLRPRIGGARAFSPISISSGWQAQECCGEVDQSVGGHDAVLAFSPEPRVRLNGSGDRIDKLNAAAAHHQPVHSRLVSIAAMVPPGLLRRNRRRDFAGPQVPPLGEPRIATAAQVADPHHAVDHENVARGVVVLGIGRTPEFPAVVERERDQLRSLPILKASAGDDPLAASLRQRLAHIVTCRTVERQHHAVLNNHCWRGPGEPAPSDRTRAAPHLLAGDGIQTHYVRDGLQTNLAIIDRHGRGQDLAGSLELLLPE